MSACTASRRGRRPGRSTAAPPAAAAVCVLALSRAAAADRRGASTWRPNQLAAASLQGFKATAPKGFEPCPAGAEAVSIEDAPSVRSTDASTPLALSNSSGGFSMAKNAANLICPPLKSFLVNGLGVESLRNGGVSRNRMILRSYTLCAVNKTDEQPVPRPPSPVPVQSRPVPDARPVEFAASKLVMPKPGYYAAPKATVLAASTRRPLQPQSL